MEFLNKDLKAYLFYVRERWRLAVEALGALS